MVHFDDAPRLQASAVACNPLINGHDNVQDALAGSSSPAGGTMNANARTRAVYAQIAAAGMSGALDGLAQTGFGTILLVAPITTYAIGSVVDSFNADIAPIPDSTDPFAIQATITVCDATGTNSVVVAGTTTGAAHATFLDFDAATLAAGATVGADLSYDAATHEIKSAAGGAYGIVAEWVFNWS
jgi:hypothetical protein